MNICGYEKMSMVDFQDLLACTIFTDGCNFLCPFCHNSSLVVGTNNSYIDEQEILDYLVERKNILEGVCVSGGEPTLQPDLAEFLSKIKQLGYKTKLDTNGQNPTKLASLIEQGLVDYVAMDIKNSPSKYGLSVGIDNFDTKNITKSIQILQSSNIDYEFRTTLVDGHHSVEDIETIGKWIQGSPRYYLQHFKDSGSCIQPNLQGISRDTAILMQRTAQKYVKLVGLRGY